MENPLSPPSPLNAPLILHLILFPVVMSLVALSLLDAHIPFPPVCFCLLDDV